MALVSHSPRRRVKPLQRDVRHTCSGAVFDVEHTGWSARLRKMYFPWLLESLESPSECDVSHIVVFLTWLLESPYECEIAHMVPRARTLVPISESETKLAYQVPGFSQHRRCVIARGRLRRHPAHPPAFGSAPSGFEIAALRASGAPPVGLPRLGRLRRSEGPSRASEGRLRAWEGPRSGGGLRDQSAGAALGRIFAHAQLTSAAL